MIGQINRILVVEDDPDDLQIMREAFEEVTDKRTEIEFLDTGDQLINRMTELPAHKLPSLLILDMNLPGRNGLEILLQVKKESRYAHIPIVIITTSNAESDRDRSYRVGANCFISKPDSYKGMLDMFHCIVTLWGIKH